VRMVFLKQDERIDKNWCPFCRQFDDPTPIAWLCPALRSRFFES
jgi:hypothetical protein